MNNPLLAVLVLISLPAVVSLVTLIVLSVETRKVWRMREEMDRIESNLDDLTTRQTIKHQCEEESEQWIPDDYGYYHCSGCGYEPDGPETVSPYCPRCGARMESEEE